MKILRYYYEVIYQFGSWTITPLADIPSPMYEVITIDGDPKRLMVYVFAWNGLCPALMEGRRLIENHMEEKGRHK